MVKYLRQVQECIRKVEYGIAEDKLYVKNNCNEYIFIVQELISLIEVFINRGENDLEYWYSVNISLFLEEENSFFDRIYHFLGRCVCDYNLNRISKEMDIARHHKKKLGYLATRLNQIKYLL